MIKARHPAHPNQATYIPVHLSEQVDWQQAPEKIQPKEMVKQIRLDTHTGRPLASNSFIGELDKLMNKRLRPLPVGRPKKIKTG
jgi:hypothetical protein